MELDEADLGRTQHDIGNVIAARTGIESDRITERRKHAGVLKDLLQLPHVLDHIDSCSSGRGGDGSLKTGSRSRLARSGSALTWMSLFRSVLVYVEKAADNIEKLEDKGVNSATAVSSRLSKKKDVGDMLRMYVRAANKKVSLPVSEVMKHMVSVLESKSLGVWLGNDYSHILFNYIVSMPEYVVQITAVQWDELISLYCHLFLSSQPTIDKALVAKIIHALISHSILQTDVPIYKLYCFFAKALPSVIKEERNTHVLEHLLAAFNTFSSSSAIYNARGRLSRLGEEILPNVLGLWSKVTHPVRDQMITFLRLQMSIHYPCGRHTDEEGAWCFNDSLFKKNLEKLYDIIISDFELSATRIRWEGKSDGSRPFALLDLAADVVYQTMYIRDQMSLSTTDPALHRDKRHKSQTCWSTLSDGLTSSTDKASLTWLQLISWLVTKWPDCLPTRQHFHLLTSLCKLLRESKRSDCIKWLFVCLSALASNPTSLIVQSSPLLGSIQISELWRKVWLSTIKILSVHTAEVEGYNLLSLLLELGLVECDMEPWKLLNTAFNLPLSPIVSFIASILQNHTLPDRPLAYVTTPITTPTIMPTQTLAAIDHSACYSSYPLRSQLLHFLIPLALDEVGVESHNIFRRVSHGTMRMVNSTSPMLLAHILVSLTQRSFSSARLSFLKSLYMPARNGSLVYVRGFLEAQFGNDIQTGEGSWQESYCSGKTECSNNFEHVFLESSFDVPLVLPCLHNEMKDPLNLSCEHTIGVVKSLLLDLLSRRSDLLLQPTEFLATLSSRERCQHLSVLLETQAYHCSVVFYSLLFLWHSVNFDLSVGTPSLGTITRYLKEIAASLENPLWNEVDISLYYQTVRVVLRQLQPLVNFSQLDVEELSSSAAKAVMVVRKQAMECFPLELMEMVQRLTRGKCPILPNSSLTGSSSAFSLGGSSNRSDSRRPSDAASSHYSDSPFPEDDLELSESTTSFTADAVGSKTTRGPDDILRVSCLNPKALCQLEAAMFLCYCYKSFLAGGGVAIEGVAMFDYKSALLSMLTEGLDLRKPVYVQMVFESVLVLVKGKDCMEAAVVDTLMDMFGELLSVHRKNQCVYLESLQMLLLLSRHLCQCGPPPEKSTIAREKCQTLISAFWGLYLEGTLPSRVRLKLGQVIQALFERDRTNLWSSIIIKKKKRKGDVLSEQLLSPKEALVQMMKDSDHCMRMYMAQAIATLFIKGCGIDSCDSHVTLLCKEEQEGIFEKVSEMLKETQVMDTHQDEFSDEDDSVSRVSSMITTLLYEACVSPVCERKVVPLLITAVGEKHIDIEVVRKALGQLACYLDYQGTRQLLEDMLISLVSYWMNAGLQLTEFPVSLMGYVSYKDFLNAYRSEIIPFLVFKCDEPMLKSIADHVLATPINSLLKESLPSSMVLILTNYALQDSVEGSKEKKKADNSHKLLIRYLTEEVVAHITQHSIDEFVVQLLVRMSEPHNSHVDLAKYTLPSDPEPCSPHFTSQTVESTLDYMPSCYGNTATSFVKLLSHRKDNIQRILLSLAMRIQNTHREFEKRRYLLGYHLFVKLVCREFGSGLDNTRSFIVMDIIHTVIRILSAGEKEDASKGTSKRELFTLCCDTLEVVCKATLEFCPDELSKHLDSVVAVLTPFARNTLMPAGKQALSLLTYILESVDPARVAYLDPFPKEEPFTQISRKQAFQRQEVDGVTLTAEIDRFLSVGHKCMHSVRSTALMFIQRLLHSSRVELSLLAKQGSTSPVLQLIRGLVLLCQGSVSSARCVSDVSRCLGEIGPVDLGCIAIPTRGHESFDTSVLPATWSPASVRSTRILHHLGALLLDRDISVVQASGECLRCILATKIGQLVLSNLEDESDDIGEWCLYLEPFKHHRKTKVPGSAPTLPPPSSFSSLVDLPDLWIPSEGVSHQAWITRLVTTLVKCGAVTDQLLLLIEPICRVKVELCEAVFPILVHDILSSNNDDYHRVVSGNVQLFFTTVAISQSSHPSTPSPSTQGHTPPTIRPLNPDSVRTMLNMVLFLRTVDRPRKSRGSSHSVTTPWENNFWLDLNFLDVAMAAQIGSAYFTSLLYIEIWHGANQQPPSSRYRKGSSGSTPERMDVDPSQSGTGLHDHPKVQQLLLEAYSRIGEPDSLYGACTTMATDEMTRVRLYEHEGQWHKSLGSYSLQAQLPGASCESNIAESLHQLGLAPILNMYLSGVESVKGGGVRSEGVSGVEEYQYEAAWRLTTWEDRPGSHTPFHINGRKEGYHQSVFNCITALRERETDLFEKSLSEARCHVIHSLCSTGLESTYSLYPSLGKLLSLLELEEAYHSTLPEQAPSRSREDGLGFLKDWTERLPSLDSDFQFVESVLALRHSTVYCLLQAAGREVKVLRDSSVSICREVETMFAAVRDNLLTQTKLAREAGRYQVAEGALFNLKQLHVHQNSFCIPESLCPSLLWTIQLEEAKLEWEKGEGPLAMSLLKSLLQRFKQHSHLAPDIASLYPVTLSLYGNWLAETQSESPSIIMSEFLEKSVSLMAQQQTKSSLPEIVSASLTLARFADMQYQRIKRHMESPTFQNKKDLMERSKQELEKLQMMLGEDRSMTKHVRTLTAQSEEDKIALENLLAEKQQFLEKALHNYIQCLKAGDDHDLRVFRLCALWFANSGNQKVNEIVQNGVDSLESRKFLPLMYQLAARMSARALKSDLFQKALQDVIYRSTRDHPYHCLYSILALSNASKDEKFPSSGHVTGTKISSRISGRLSRNSNTGLKGSVDEDKVKAASGLISKLREEKPVLVQATEQLCDAYMDLAYHDVTVLKKERGPIKLPVDCPLLKLGRSCAAVPTLDIDVDQSCCYENVVCVDGFDPFFQLVGGVNLPKIISCISSDGKRRKQLVKGKDDLRQDAIMQQVFILVNRLLKKEPATSKRRLCVRTYKVIPLSQRAGIVEWCEETCPLGEYLIGHPRNPQQGAHCRYHPNDWTALECRKKLMETGSYRRLSKFNVYTEICKHFQPVFHHFFMEKFPHPPQWFERRLTYVRSVATSSIIGYLLGLGDRHVQNILIDTNTADFIHIDLGVAFEQGKTLPTPETVPFRLTRDVVDGMGITGVEGVFRRCCEKTTVLMRAHQEELRTIVEVLLHDPLYQWTLSPLKALNLQRYDDISATPSSSATARVDINGGQASSNAGGGAESNKMAERVLLRLQEKLGGIEDGVPLSVSGQVNKLIQEATDPANLCALFPGWQPWI